MQQIERFAYISEVLRREGTVSVKFLAETLGVSESTVRRDLQRFLKMTQLPLKRIRGGLLLDIDKGAIEPVYQAKLSIMKQEKIRIIGYFDVPPILATLGGMTLYRGISIAVTKGKAIAGLPLTVAQIGRGSS